MKKSNKKSGKKLTSSFTETTEEPQKKDEAQDAVQTVDQSEQNEEETKAVPGSTVVDVPSQASPKDNNDEKLEEEKVAGSTQVFETQEVLQAPPLKKSDSRFNLQRDLASEDKDP